MEKGKLHASLRESQVARVLGAVAAQRGEDSVAATRLKDAPERRLAALLDAPIELALDLAVDNSESGGGGHRGKRDRPWVCVLGAQLACETSTDCVLSANRLLRSDCCAADTAELICGELGRCCSRRARASTSTWRTSP